MNLPDITATILLFFTFTWAWIVFGVIIFGVFHPVGTLVLLLSLIVWFIISSICTIITVLLMGILTS